MPVYVSHTPHAGGCVGKCWLVKCDRYTLPLAAFYDEPDATRYAAKAQLTEDRRSERSA